MRFLIQTGLDSTTLTAIATIVAAIVGALLGSYGTYKGQERRRRRKEADELRKLRIGLLTELVGMARYTKRLQNLHGSEGVEFELHRAASMSTDVYDANINRIVSLSDDEAEILIHLYDELKSANKTFQAVAEASIAGEEIDINGIEDYAEDIFSELPVAIVELKKRLDESDIPDFAKDTNIADD